MARLWGLRGKIDFEYESYSLYFNYRLSGCSISVFKPFPLLAHYSASKAVVRNLTQGSAVEWAKFGIIVNACAPGIVRTAMWEQIDAG